MSIKDIRAAGRGAVEMLPDRIVVGPFDLMIIHMDSHLAGSEQSFGQFRCLEQAIYIQLDMPSPHKAVDTMLHEVGHAIYWAHDIDDEDKEERIVSVMATGWTQVYRNNPWLLSWMGEVLHGWAGER